MRITHNGTQYDLDIILQCFSVAMFLESCNQFFSCDMAENDIDIRLVLTSDFRITFLGDDLTGGTSLELCGTLHKMFDIPEGAINSNVVDRTPISDHLDSLDGIRIETDLPVISETGFSGTRGRVLTDLSPANSYILSFQQDFNNKGVLTYNFSCTPRQNLVYIPSTPQLLLIEGTRPISIIRVSAVAILKHYINGEPALVRYRIPMSDCSRFEVKLMFISKNVDFTQAQMQGYDPKFDKYYKMGESSKWKYELAEDPDIEHGEHRW